MKRALICTAFATALLAGVAVAPAAAADAKPAAPEMAPPAVSSERADVVSALNDAQEKLIALAEATPAEKFAWRPAEGVRSVGEVYLHVAQANFGIPTIWGGKPPAGIDMANIEKNGNDKTKTVALLKQSFDEVHKSIDAVSPADLTKSINFFGHPSTVQAVMVLLATHAHEHLGQSIAYARMNGITPPWSAAQQEQMKKAHGK